MTKDEKLIKLRRQIRNQIQFLQKAETEGKEFPMSSHIAAWRGFQVQLGKIINE